VNGNGNYFALARLAEDVEQNCAMREGWNAQVVDAMMIVKIKGKKVRQE
jgi:hypothetical protein